MIYSKQSNSVSHSRTSKYTGVTWNRSLQKWVSYITANKIRYDCGYHETEKDAALSRDKKIIALYLKKPLQILKKVEK